ncbi:hypothetical protein SCHPADRAFT_827308, partial [Schizopora paradoxa]
MGTKRSSKKKDDDSAPQDSVQADAPKGKAKAVKAKVELAPILWNQDGSKLVFALLTEMEKDENRIVLCGKRPGEVRTSGDSKNTVYRRIAQAIFPEICKISIGHATVVSERVRVKAEYLFKQYKEKARRLYQTGEGIGGEESTQGNGTTDTTDTQATDTQATDEYATYYVGEDGPDAFTPPDILNIWDHIEKAFPAFSRLHKL